MGILKYLIRKTVIRNTAGIATLLAFLFFHVQCTGNNSPKNAPVPVQAANCTRAAGSVPYPQMALGKPSTQIPIENIFVIMQENRSFDSYFGRLNSEKFYGDQIDGITPAHFNLDAGGIPVPAHHEPSLCIPDTGHHWEAVHDAWNGGRNDGFVRINSSRGIGFYDETDLPYYYALANHFAVADRYFCSVLSQTYPNRFFLLTGTAFGHIRNDWPETDNEFSQKTIFDLLDQHGVTWGYYTSGGDYLATFSVLHEKSAKKIKNICHFEKDLAQGKLPQVVFLESGGIEDEHPPYDIQVGQAWVARRVNALMKSSYWKKSILFFTYDENGGLYDHVPPPQACIPDDIPIVEAGARATPGGFDYYGFRVPFIAVSPYVKRHYVSHTTYDHTSILKFIETKFNLPALTRRDANADAMMDLFDFDHPQFDLPKLPEAEPDMEKLSKCLNGDVSRYHRKLKKEKSCP